MRIKINTSFFVAIAFLFEYWPTAQIEVVVYNQGIGYLMTKNSKHLAEIKTLKSMGVDFVVCQNTMKQRNVKPEELVSEARIVPAGIAEIVLKQEKKWSYIKGGF
jgi:intracellular sulfur oxidation DsrE/DsrF family protein